MPHIINILTIWGKYQNEQHNNSRNEHHLAFKHSSYNIKSSPIYDYIRQDNSNYTKEWSWGTSLNSIIGRVSQIGKDITSYPRYQVDKDSLKPAKRVLHSTDKYKRGNKIANQMQEVHMKKLSRNQPINLPRLYARGEIRPQSFQHVKLNP